MAYFPVMRPEELLVPTAAGLYCRPGGFHIDPTRPVARALITHGHSDHARAGHGAVLATPETIDLMRLRYGENFAAAVQGVRYGERLTIGGVAVSFHPAGHILGSAQILVEAGGAGGAGRAGGLRVVASGDYKDTDPTCAPFEPIPCDVFITEAMFALPVFRHGDPKAEIAKCCGRWRCSPSAPLSSAPIRSARRSASSPCCAKRATTGPSISTAPWRR
jgi:putative mRNA 3-end processing factor